MLIQGNRFGEQQILDKYIVIAIDSNPVSRIDDIISYLDINKKVGDKVNLTVNRNGQTIDLIATLEARPNLPLQEIQSQSEPNNDCIPAYTPFPNFKLPPLPEFRQFWSLKFWKRWQFEIWEWGIGLGVVIIRFRL